MPLRLARTCPRVTTGGAGVPRGTGVDRSHRSPSSIAPRSLIASTLTIAIEQLADPAPDILSSLFRRHRNSFDLAAHISDQHGAT